MLIPIKTKNLIDLALKEMRSAPQHHLPPVQRFNIYHSFGPVAKPPTLAPIRGWLAISAARYVLPIWENSIPNWLAEKNGIKHPFLGNNRQKLIWRQIASLPSRDKGAEFDVSFVKLPAYLLSLAEDAITGMRNKDAVWAETEDNCDIVGNIGMAIFESEVEGPGNAFYAFDAAKKSIHEALSDDFLGRVPGWERYSDNHLPRFTCDAASSAMIAYAGGGEDCDGERPSNPKMRKEFWDWWLIEAIPTAFKRALNNK